MNYSFTIGLRKGITSALTILAAFLALAGFSDITIWGLLEEYLEPLLGSLTIGGAITMLANYVKIKKQAQ